MEMNAPDSYQKGTKNINEEHKRKDDSANVVFATKAFLFLSLL